MTKSGSVTCWLGNLKEGDLAAAQPLWERYFSRLVAVARGKLKKVRRASAGEDEEDAALSAFNSFCGGDRAGPVSPARRPRRPLEAAGRDHGAQGHGPGPARGAARSAAAAGSWTRPSCSGRGRRRGLDRRPRADRRRGAHPRVRRDDGRGMRAPARLARRRLAPPGRPQPDGGLHERRDRRPARLRRRTIARRLDLIRKTWMSLVEEG